MLYDRNLVLTGLLAGHSYQKCPQEDWSVGVLTNPYKKQNKMYITHVTKFSALATNPLQSERLEGPSNGGGVGAILTSLFCFGRFLGLQTTCL